MDEYGDEIKKMPKWNIALYDIETDIRSEMTFEEMRQNAIAEITAISIWFSNTDESYCLSVVPPYLRDFWDKDEEKRSGFTIVYFDTEKDLLDYFYYLLDKNNTMAVGAWNADFFDSAYIYNRTKVYYSEEETST
jgi:DNA polymerase elongation subunit (family B)